MPNRSKEERKKTYHNDTPQERSVRKKTEKLWQCTAEIEKEMVELESKHKRDKKQSSKEADERKADFLRQSAAIQRRIDDNAAEMQKHTQAIAQLEPEANEMRQQLRDPLPPVAHAHGHMGTAWSARQQWRGNLWQSAWVPWRVHIHRDHRVSSGHTCTDQW